ncbi:MAG TPA: hypothetical protein VMY39_08275, partial [Planctomycetota bacterium]|nr:hypothetical protein [Planctomycetota bacterium]
MALKMALRWKNPDSSADINLRTKDVFAKGFVTGGNIVPSLISLQVVVEPFVLVNFDGAVVVSDANETLAVIDGQINYVVCRARFREGDSAIATMQVLTEAQYLADAEINHLHVVGVVDLSLGGPYAFPPLARVFYENRHILDQQSRTAWREPVATFGALPTGSANFNRDGDVRLTLDTGSLYFWNESLGIWDIFDEVPLQTHRDFEHTNGITGSSAATTLQPDINGTDMRINPVPAGSGYTANGRFLTSPLVITDISAAGVGALRGLIQVAFDETGATVSNYRVQKSADILDIAYARIIGISDDHPLGAFSLVYDNIGGTLAWSGGPPVVATTGNAVRLPDATGVNWIDMDLVGAAPGGLVSDNYDVNSNLKNDDHLLVGQWYWDGAATLALGTDKREFGNLGNPELSDDFKDKEFHPRWEDLRGNMIYSGGTTTDLGGFNARVQGPIISYIEGVRYEVAGAYNGVAVTAGTVMIPAINYIYVNSAGALTVSTTNPATGTSAYATVSQVTTNNVGITAIADQRDPQLIVGQATRDARLIMSGSGSMEWSHPTTGPLAGDIIVQFLKNGATSGTHIFSHTLETNSNITAAGGNIESQAGSVIADVDVVAGDNITATAGDVIATLGDLVASAGGVTALAGLIRGLNLTADNDLTVENLSVLKNVL